jgi:hypothetical protein
MRQLVREWRLPVLLAREMADGPEPTPAADVPAGEPILEANRDFHLIGSMGDADKAVQIVCMTLRMQAGAARPTRAQLAAMARGICRQLAGRPVLAAFQYGRHLSLAFVEPAGNRHASCPLKVSLMRDISLDRPLPAHRRWLESLKYTGPQQDGADDAAGHQHLKTVFSAAYWRKSFMDAWHRWLAESGNRDERLIRLAIRQIATWLTREACAVPAHRDLLHGQLDRWFSRWMPGQAEGDEPCGESLQTLLVRFPCTLEENTPLVADAALDPEIMGAVFEHWLASGQSATSRNARISTGSFYTPKVIVGGMVERALAAYLKERLPGDDAARERQLAMLLSGEDVEDREDGLPPGDRQWAGQIVRLLDACKIFDPACGSGAFLIGALHVMTALLRKLDPHNVYWKQQQLSRAAQLEDAAARAMAMREIEDAFACPAPDYARKRFLIQHCLYGVDIQPLAVQICKLRLMLSLLAERHRHKWQPDGDLPSFAEPEAQVVAANALVALDMPEPGWNLGAEWQAIAAERHMIRRRLRDADELAQVCKLREDERALRSKLADQLKQQGWRDASVRQLIEWEPDDPHRAASFFDKTWMFNLREGFDIVIGNPPYLGERKNKPHFLAVQQSPLGRYYLGRMDYFYFFFHLAIDLLAEGGVGAFLTTNYFPTALGARKLRTDLKNRTTLLELIDFHETKIFEGAAGQHNLITVFRRGKRPAAAKVKHIHETGVLTEEQLANVLRSPEGELRLAQDELWDGEENYLRLSGISGKSAPINLALDLLKEAATDVLGNICRPLIGLESSLDSVYVADRDFWAQTLQDEREWEHVKPFFKNSDIARYRASHDTNRFILYLHEGIPDITALPGIYRHLLANRPLIENRKGANLRGAYRRGNWWVLNTPRLDMDFEDEKIVTPYRSRTNRFAIVREPWYASRDVYYIVKRKPDVSLSYILALLNSTLYYQWLYHRGKRKGDMLELYAKPLKEIPVREVDPAAQQPFIRLAELATHAAAHEPDKLPVVEMVIDALVFDLVFGNHMKARGLETTPWIVADLHAVIGDRDLAAFGPRAQREMLAALCGRWTDREGEVAGRIRCYAERSPELLGPILNSSPGREWL